MSLALFFAQHVSNASTFIFRSLRLCVGLTGDYFIWFILCALETVCSGYG